MADALPPLDGLAVAVAHLGGVSDGAGGRLGGMWCDVTVSDDGYVALTLVDARAAPEPVASQLRRALAALGPHRSAAATVDGLDRAARGIPGAVGTGALCVTFDPAGAVGWSTAGSGPPSTAGPDGVRALSGGPGEPLGCAHRDAAQAQEPLPAGTTVVLGAGSDLAERTVASVLTEHHDLAPAALAAALEDAALDVTAPGDGAGPGTLVLARLLPAPLEQRVPADPRRLSAVRRTVTSWSAAAALSEDAAADLQLLLSEAATNAVEHAYRETDAGEFVYSVRRRRDGGVRVVVQDFGRWLPPPDDPGYRGRGLAVIHNLAQEVTLDHTEHGTRIAFTVPNDAAPLDERPLTGVTQGWKPGSGR
jgi:anti-sigma regulatory factor (Ser/Thr protein kinase)